MGRRTTGSRQLVLDPGRVKLSGLRLLGDRQLALLRPNYPDWDIWTVRVLIPPHTIWCAGPKGSPTATINTDPPEHLIELLSAGGSLCYRSVALLPPAGTG